MLEKALTGNRGYWTWVFFLLAIAGVGVLAYLRQFDEGLATTGLSRDVTWGFYVAQFTFLVGVAASAVMVVLPYYLHNFKAFGRITILGEFVAIGSVIMCMSFLFVDLGQPFRGINVFLYPSPGSPMFWDGISLSGYLLLNVIISRITLDSEKKGIAPPRWIKPIIYLSIPWAISIHTVTAFLYSGLAARPFWMTAVLAPRFLASAFAAGPALLVIVCLIMRKFTRFDPGEKAIQTLAKVMTYGMVINVFLIFMELFTTFYSGIPEHLHHFKFLYFGLDGNTSMVPWMWASTILAVIALVLLLFPKMRNNFAILPFGAIAVFSSLWIDKGLGLIIAGFTPSPFETVTGYSPTLNELLISFGVYAIGALIITGLYKVAISIKTQDMQEPVPVKEQVAAGSV